MGFGTIPFLWQSDWGSLNGHRIELELGGAWVDVTTDVHAAAGVRVSYGISGAGPLDLVASTGQMSFSLRNNESNSGGLIGYYSPGHANVRSGFTVGIGVRYRYRVPGTNTNYWKFVGRLDSIQPEPSLMQGRNTVLNAVDWMDDAARHRPTVATQIDKRADEVVASVVAAVAVPPSSTSFDTADSTFPFSLDNSRSEKQPVLAELQRIALSEYGRVYIKGEVSEIGGGGILRFEKRSARLTPMPVATFDDDMNGLSAPTDRDKVLNEVRATVHPRRVDALNTTILFTNQGTPSVPVSATVSLTGYYNDPANRDSRVGGKDFNAPVATTDYTMNTLADGTGTDLTALFVVVALYGGNSVEYTITNNSGSVGFITKLQARGRGLYDYDPVDATDSDAASIATFGERQLTIDMPYQSDATVARAVAEFVVDTWSLPGSNETVLQFIADSDARLLTAIAIEPGDAISVRETVTGLNNAFFVNHVDLHLDNAFFPTFTWTLQRALVADYWSLGTAGLSELGVTTVLAPL